MFVHINKVYEVIQKILKWEKSFKKKYLLMLLVSFMAFCDTSVVVSERKSYLTFKT